MSSPCIKNHGKWLKIRSHDRTHLCLHWRFNRIHRQLVAIGSVERTANGKANVDAVRLHVSIVFFFTAYRTLFCGRNKNQEVIVHPFVHARALAMIIIFPEMTNWLFPTAKVKCFNCTKITDEFEIEHVVVATSLKAWKTNARTNILMIPIFRHHFRQIEKETFRFWARSLFVSLFVDAKKLTKSKRPRKWHLNKSEHFSRVNRFSSFSSSLFAYFYFDLFLRLLSDWKWKKVWSRCCTSNRKWLCLFVHSFRYSFILVDCVRVWPTEKVKAKQKNRKTVCNIIDSVASLRISIVRKRGNAIEIETEFHCVVSCSCVCCRREMLKRWFSMRLFIISYYHIQCIYVTINFY